jgi:hypothetical protein
MGTTKETLCIDGLIGATVTALAGKDKNPGPPEQKARPFVGHCLCNCVQEAKNKSHAKQIILCV